MLTVQELKEDYFYSPRSGEFLHRRSEYGHRRATLAGHLNKSDGYIDMTCKGRRYRAHRLAWLYMTGVWPRKYIDHKNRQRDDNRWCNLREADEKENSRNSSVRIHNTLQVKGVKKKGNRFIALITHNRKQVYLGSFTTVEDASNAYQNKAKELHKEFAS